MSPSRHKNKNTTDAPDGHFRLALCQLFITSDKQANLSGARRLVSMAAKKADVVVLPECFICPYSLSNMIRYAESFPDGETYETLSSMAQESGIMLIGGSIPERGEDGKLYNSCVVFGPDGKCIAKHRKIHLSDEDIINGIAVREEEIVAPGNSLTLVDIGYARIGIGIRDDLGHPELIRLASRNGCVAMIVPTAFPSGNAQKYWELLQRTRAIENHIYIATCSPAVNFAEPKQHLSVGLSAVISPSGESVSTAHHEEMVVYAEIDQKLVLDACTRAQVSEQKVQEAYPEVNYRVADEAIEKSYV
ncbi:uncharacterized protein VTP21DRAFT_4973 [Calcarisporiella thermophila]|uniref:uncharacterized protein n=1 Tax=Calcarisporiella thermophila TaxID=911321 RepID=UPI003744709C